MEPDDRFTLTFYVATLTQMATRPGQFFRKELSRVGMQSALGFLVLSSLLFTGVSTFFNAPGKSALIGGIYVVNGVGMAFIAAGIGYGLMKMLISNRVTFNKFFSVVALCSGTTMLVSWVPFALWLTEPWKWWLVAIGMTVGLGLRKREAAMIIGLSMVILFALFRSLLPLMQLVKMHLF